MTLMPDKRRSEEIDALIKYLDDRQLDPYNGVPILAEVIMLACISMEKHSPKPLEAAVNRMKAASRLILEAGERLITAANDVKQARKATKQ